MADSIDDMKAELIDAGYTIELQKPMGHSRAIEPEYGWVYSDVFSSSEEQLFIPYVYKHLQEKRRLAELEAQNARLLEVAREQQKKLEAHEVLANEMIEAFNEAKDSSHLLAWIESIRNRTKKLLGKE